jgi:hypothetical protein
VTRWQIEAMENWSYPDSKGNRKPNPFRAKYAETLDLLERELDHLDVVGAVAVRVVAREADVRRDGMLRAQAKVLHPGVALSFRSSSHGDLTYPCDRFEARYYGEVSWQVNLRAIALGLEALRKLDRYGIAGRGEQYAGWRAIEAPGSRPAFASADEAIRWLRELTDWPAGEPAVLDRLLRRASAITHPDRGGDRSLWDRVDAARQLLEGGGR